MAGKIGGGRAVALGFALATLGFAVLAFVEASWTYAAFVGPLLVLSVGLGLANGPASSGSTAAVSADQVGSAAGISNMARYVGAAVAVAVIAMVNNAVANNHRDAGESASDALAAGLCALRADDGDLVRRRRPADRPDAAAPRDGHAGRSTARPRRRRRATRSRSNPLRPVHA